MKTLIKKIEWWFDYYVGFFVTNGNKLDRYHQFMMKKYGENYNHFKTIKQ